MRKLAPKTDGQLRAGAPIPGSGLLRAYCRVCRQPIRVTKSDFKDGDCECDRCRGEFHPARVDDKQPPDPDADGSWGNAVRRVEGDG